MGKLLMTEPFHPTASSCHHRRPRAYQQQRIHGVATWSLGYETTFPVKCKTAVTQGCHLLPLRGGIEDRILTGGQGTSKGMHRQALEQNELGAHGTLKSKTKSKNIQQAGFPDGHPL